jgi:uncharacterized protein (DUF1778 family)
MPIERKNYTLQRPDAIKVMVTTEERDELRKAAARASMGLSVFVRATALEAARRREPRAA